MMNDHVGFDTAHRMAIRSHSRGALLFVLTLTLISGSACAVANESEAQSTTSNEIDSTPTQTTPTGDGEARLSPSAQRTLDNYYAHVNRGDFLGAAHGDDPTVNSACAASANQTSRPDACFPSLAPDATFNIPGTGLLPFTGTWQNRDDVVCLFNTFMWAFHFDFEHFPQPIKEVVQIGTEDELISFNQESFVMNDNGCSAEQRQNKRYTVNVIHDFRFNSEGLISSMTNYHDSYAAELAYLQHDAYDTVLLDASLPVALMNDSDATGVVADWLRGDDSKLAEDVVWNVPGPGGDRSDGLDFTSANVEPRHIFAGSDAVTTNRNRVSTRLSSLIDPSARLIANNGRVAAIAAEDAPASRAITLFELGNDGSAVKIKRMTSYFDTAPLIARRDTGGGCGHFDRQAVCQQTSGANTGGEDSGSAQQDNKSAGGDSSGGKGGSGGGGSSGKGGSGEGGK